MKPNKDLDIQIEPLFEIDGEEIRGFDRSWRRAIGMETPVKVTFVKWVRKEQQ